MTASRPNRKTTRPGFTLVELMASMALISLLTLVMLSMVNQTSSTWKFTKSKVEQFGGARNAFEAITRNLSQATLNTYWDYQYDTANKSIPSKYFRQSNLRFLAGSTKTILGGTTPPRPTHSIFFQAPLGFVDQSVFRGLDNLLNTWGYYVEFQSDKAARPSFINALTPAFPERYRYRLMEVMQPSNKLSIYTPGPGPYDWVTTVLASSPSPVHVLTENVVALVLRPKLSGEEDATGVLLAPKYSYDSTTPPVSGQNPKTNTQNQLPPLVQVTLIAIDEQSAARLAHGSDEPALGLAGVFGTSTASDNDQYEKDLKTLQDRLAELHVNYRTFSSQVSIRAAKWSTE